MKKLFLALLLCAAWLPGQTIPTVQTDPAAGTGCPGSPNLQYNDVTGNIFVCVRATGWQPLITSSGSGTLTPSTAGQVCVYTASTTCAGFANNVYINSTIAAPNAPVVSGQGGTPGMTSYTYTERACTYAGCSVDSGSVTTMTGPAALNTTDYNIVVTSAGASPSQFCVLIRDFNLIWTGTCGSTVNDTGLAADPWVAFTVGSTGMGLSRLAIGNNPGTQERFQGQVVNVNVLQTAAGQELANIVQTLNPTGSGGNYTNFHFVQNPIGVGNFGALNNVFGLTSINSTGTVGVGRGGFFQVNNGDLLGGATVTTGLHGIEGDVQTYGGSTPIAAGVWAWIGNYGGTITLGSDFYGQAPDTGGTMPTFSTFYSEAIGGKATNAYSYWHDEQGVYRIKADNTFDGVYQAIPALYNPQFTKYTPGAVNYERIVEQWNGNVAEIGVENGGTGTLRVLRFIGASVALPGTSFTFNGKTCTIVSTVLTCT